METEVHQFISQHFTSVLFPKRKVFVYKLHAYMVVDHTVFYDMWSLKVSKTTEMQSLTEFPIAP